MIISLRVLPMSFLLFKDIELKKHTNGQEAQRSFLSCL